MARMCAPSVCPWIIHHEDFLPRANSLGATDLSCSPIADGPQCGRGAPQPPRAGRTAGQPTLATRSPLLTRPISQPPAPRTGRCSGCALQMGRHLAHKVHSGPLFSFPFGAGGLGQQQGGGLAPALQPPAGKQPSGGSGKTKLESLLPPSDLGKPCHF